MSSVLWALLPEITLVMTMTMSLCVCQKILYWWVPRPKGCFITRAEYAFYILPPTNR